MQFAVETLTTWNDIHKYVRHGWLYRGQRVAAWEPQTSLERCCDRQGVPPMQRPEVERQLFSEFRRAYHQYAQHVPHPDSILEWLSLMQHHGAPSRVLDFTYSIYVAAYFAIEAADVDCAVWAVNGPWALQESHSAMKRSGKPDADRLLELFVEGHERILQGLFFEPPYVLSACPLNPFRLNERLRTQKGAFLVPSDITASFRENLEALSGYDDAMNVIQLVIPLALRRDALRQLFQMNISNTSLFPGLDGYARSLGIYHPAFDPVRWV